MQVNAVNLIRHARPLIVIVSVLVLVRAVYSSAVISGEIAFCPSSMRHLLCD